jgi:translation initiation factor IF-3
MSRFQKNQSVSKFLEFPKKIKILIRFQNFQIISNDKIFKSLKHFKVSI